MQDPRAASTWPGWSSGSGGPGSRRSCRRCAGEDGRLPLAMQCNAMQRLDLALLSAPCPSRLQARVSVLDEGGRGCFQFDRTERATLWAAAVLVAFVVVTWVIVGVLVFRK